jgi:hypothetical protein
VADHDCLLGAQYFDTTITLVDLGAVIDFRISWTALKLYTTCRLVSTWEVLWPVDVCISDEKIPGRLIQTCSSILEPKVSYSSS